MELVDIILSYSLAVGQWQASVVINNGGREPLRGVGSGKCGEEAVREAIYRAMGINCDCYDGEVENPVLDFARELVSGLSSPISS
jgi:hypothetical protein